MRSSRLLYLAKVWLGSLMMLAASANVLFAQPRVTLEKIEVVGLKRMTGQQVIALSGLQIGQVIDPATLDAASDKLLKSGLFRRLSYRVRTTRAEATVIFEIEESARTLPVVFENFVWFSDDEILAAIRREVPFFNGAAPATGETTEKIAAALQRLLASRNIPGQVEFLPYITGDTQELLFTVKGARVPVCSVHFPGSSIVPEADLVNAAREILNAEYSRKDLAAFAPLKLIPLYRRRGLLRAEFQPPGVTLPNTPQCPSGVEVTIPVEEGQVYYWTGSEWNGNDKLTVDELASALGMNPGEIADGTKIEKGLKEVRRAYARRGHLNAQVTETIEFAEGGAPRVRYIFNISEGPRYFMGNLIVTGLSAADAEAVKSRWTLGANAVFDESYVDQFRQTALREFMTTLAQRSRGSRPKVEVETRPDARKLTVDVLLNFK